MTSVTFTGEPHRSILINVRQADGFQKSPAGLRDVMELLGCGDGKRYRFTITAEPVEEGKA